MLTAKEHEYFLKTTVQLHLAITWKDAQRFTSLGQLLEITIAFSIQFLCTYCVMTAIS